MKFNTVITFNLLMLLSVFAQAREVAGLDIPEVVSHSDQSTKLVLNGAGVRSKFIFDIYIGALYLERKIKTPEQAYALSGEKRMSMHFLYKEVSKEKLIEGWNEGFKNNLNKTEFTDIQPRLTKFNNLFVTVKKNDVINLDLIPTTGTIVMINNKIMGTIEGDDFYTALLKVWLGDEPADSNLKQAMLGQKSESN